jgi:ankyrin repeat protein
MTVNCASHHLRCDSSKRVATAARGILGGRALISEPCEGWVSVWDEDGCDEDFDELPRIAARLSQRLGAPCMSFFVGEDGATRYWLHDSGRLVDTYVSRGAEPGDAPALAGYCLGGTDPEDLREILDADATFEQERIGAIAEMLGIEPERASLSYAAIAGREDAEADLSPDAGDEVAETETSEPEPPPEPPPPLHAAARAADPAALRLLLEEGADPNGRDSEGSTALHACARSLSLDFEEMDATARGEWWRRNAQARSEATEREEEPARAWERERRLQLPGDALELGASVARTLLEAGAQADAPDDKGERPLTVAAREGHSPVLNLLLSSGADPGAADSDGATALHAAASWGFEALVTRLLEHGVDADPADAWGWTPLMLAAEGGYEGTVDLLLAAGADPRRENGAGRSISGVASDAGRKALAARLREL